MQGMKELYFFLAAAFFLVAVSAITEEFVCLVSFFVGGCFTVPAEPPEI